MGRAMYLDLGTSNSCVAVLENGQPVVLCNQEGSRTTPSVVAFTKDGDRLVGQVAKRQAVTNPKNTIFSAKRFIGRKYKDCLDEKVPYEVKATSNGDVCFEIMGKTYTPEEISSKVVQKMKQVAEDYLGEKVTDIIVTVPAYFDDASRAATKTACVIAGLNVLRIIAEPTAAALAYGVDKKENATIAVFDEGGGTFDFSILEIGDGVFEVKATSGDTHLGGDDFDQAIMDWLVQEFKKEHGIDLSKDNMALQRLKEESEKAKIALSSSLTYSVNLPFITADANGPKHLAIDLTRSKFESLVSHLLEKSKAPCLQALKDAGLTPDKIDEVILVGGTTRIPAVQELVEKLFGKKPNMSVNPDEAVAIGAAVQGAVLSGDKSASDIVLLDVTPLSLGLELQGGIFHKIIERNTTIPTKKSQVFSTVIDNQSQVSIHVLQGERDFAQYNKTLGKFDLVGIPPSPRGIPQIEVTFNIDVNGIVTVSAKDMATGKEQKIEIIASSGLSDDEIKKMVEESERHAEEDRKKREEIEVRNHSESMIYTSEKFMKENEISDEEKNNLQEKIDALKKAESIEDIKRLQEELIQEQHKISIRMYENKTQNVEAEVVE